MMSDNENINPPSGIGLAEEASLLEDVAALADGSLSEERRAAVLARLADDPDLLDVLAEVSAIQEAELESEAAQAPAADTRDREEAAEPAEPQGRILRGPWRRRAWTAVAALAAVLALVVIAPRLLSAGPPTPELLLASLDVQALEAETLESSLWSPNRGPGGGDEDLDKLGPRDSFRLGLLEATVVVAVRKGEDDARRSLQGELSEIRGYGPFLDLYRELIEADDASTLLADHLQDQELILEFVDPFYYRYGLWIRTAELAASSGQTDFFRSRGGRSSKAMTPPDELADEWRRLQEKVDGAHRAGGLDELADVLAAIHDRHAR